MTAKHVLAKTTLDPRLIRTLYFVMFLAMALALHVLEGSLPPPLPIPGVKLGLANVMTTAAMLTLGIGSGLALALVRTLLGSLIVGTFLSVGFFLSGAGALASATVTALALAWCRPALSLVGVSILSALAHNTAQLVLAWAVFIQQGALFYYLPVLWLLALGSGLVTGLVLRALEQRGTFRPIAVQSGWRAERVCGKQ